MKRGKIEIEEGIELKNLECIRTIREIKTGIWEADTVKLADMKENKIRKKYHRRTKKLLETKSHQLVKLL